MRTEKDILSSIEDMQRVTKINTERIANNTVFFFWVTLLSFIAGAIVLAAKLL